METAEVPSEVIDLDHDGVVQGYDQLTVDDFLRAVAEESTRLRDSIERARARETRARTLLGMHESLLSAMHDAYRDVTRRRRASEAHAAEIVRAAERDAAEMRRDGNHLR
jgi:cell division septum initiation protein DivIVA